MQSYLHMLIFYLIFLFFEVCIFLKQIDINTVNVFVKQKAHKILTKV